MESTNNFGMSFSEFYSRFLACMKTAKRTNKRGKHMVFDDGEKGIRRYCHRAILEGTSFTGGISPSLANQCYDDVYHSALISAWKMFDPAKGANVGTCVYNGVFFAAANWARANQRTTSLDGHADRDGAGAAQAKDRFIADHSVDRGVRDIFASERAARILSSEFPEGSREAEVIRLVGEGKKFIEIAEILGVSPAAITRITDNIRASIDVAELFAA